MSFGWNLEMVFCRMVNSLGLGHTIESLSQVSLHSPKLIRETMSSLRMPSLTHLWNLSHLYVHGKCWKVALMRGDATNIERAIDKTRHMVSRMMPLLSPE